MSISIQQISYIHPDKEVLFSDLNFAISKGQKLGLVGNNGCGKSTLLQIIAGQLSPSSGVIVRPDDLYYIPQHFGQYDSLTIAQALQIERKQQALHAILAGDVSNENFTILNDDWNIEERSIAALDLWGLGQFTLSYPMNLLSGGEKTRVFLAGMDIHHPSVILMDEPTNHLDSSGRQRLYDWVEKYRSTLLVVSHDRTLLNLLPEICELEKHQINYYGGNYEFYKEQKTLMQEALQQRIEEKEKALRIARKVARETAERRDKQNVRGEKSNI
ncbi:MAG: ABC-F family ATP-binding cassette domain-containing protein, partial [Bacteroides sp.]|nr:ABC-F family ATP-binding cassette domain-containing protein [Bacteroides sp.]